MCFTGVAVNAERDVKPIRHGLQEAAASAEQRYSSPSVPPHLAVEGFSCHPLITFRQIEVYRGELWSFILEHGRL